MNSTEVPEVTKGSTLPQFTDRSEGFIKIMRFLVNVSLPADQLKWIENKNSTFDGIRNLTKQCCTTEEMFLSDENSLVLQNATDDPSNMTPLERITETDQVELETTTGLSTVISTSGGMIITDEHVLIVKIVSACLLVIALLGLLMNVVTLSLFCRQKKKTATEHFLTGLTFADVLCMLLIISISIFDICTYHLPMNEVFYIVISTLLVSVTAAVKMSCAANVCIAIERCIAVKVPLKLRLISTPSRGCFIITASFAFITAGTAITIFLLEEIISLMIHIGYQIACVVAVLIANIVTILGLRRSHAEIKKMSSLSTAASANKEKRKTRIMLMISLAFIISQVGSLLIVGIPFLDFQNESHFEEKSPLTDILYYALSRVLEITFGVVNSIILVFTNDQYKKELRKMLGCKAKK